jgi:enamine deaminase RidA (YjgF/YER057c/UK114 family)
MTTMRNGDRRRTAIGVAALPKEAIVEIGAIVALGG